jgi:membrane associated rhomboid family serine protease
VFPLKDNIPTDRTPWVTIALILANIVVFVLEIRSGGSIGSGPSAAEGVKYGFIPYELTHPGDHCELIRQTGQVACEGQPGVAGHAGAQPPTWVTLFTSMFMHGGILHIGGNMLFLWIFGNNVEDAMGHFRFIVFYLLGGLAAAGLQTVVAPNATVPNIGASGAIAAVLGGYLVLYPRARVLTMVFLIVFFTFLELPALLFLVIWFAQQVFFGLAGLTNPTGGGGGVAYFAHIGGFVFGALAIRLFAKRVKPGFGRRDPAPRYPVY